MRIRGATVRDLETAAREVGVRLAGGGPWSMRGRMGLVVREDGSIRFTLRTIEKYKRASVHFAGKLYRGEVERLKSGKVRIPTIPGAVCWHGHRDFMRVLFNLRPDAILETALATYKGRDHFEESHWATDGNIGSQYYPVQASDGCWCEESALPEVLKGYKPAPPIDVPILEACETGTCKGMPR